MQFNQGAELVTQDGKAAGHIGRVVIDPKTNEITHLVIHRGLLFREDKVVPVTTVITGREGRLTVQMSSAELELLPDFEEKHYVLMDEGQGNGPPAAVFLYPPYPGSVPGTANYGPKYITETHLNIPPNTVAVKVGAKVITRDDQEVGHVAQVLTDTPTGQVTHFLITRGFLAKESRLIPAGWVDRLNEDDVYLAIDSRTVERLPVIEPV